MTKARTFTFQGTKNTPWIVQLANRAATLLSDEEKANQQSLSFETLFKQAQKHTQCNDLGHPQFRQLLELTLQSIRNEANLCLLGRIAIKKFFMDSIQNRLLIIDALKKYPDIQQTPIHRPIIVTGLYRTGTTFLHNLLNQLPNVRAPLFWELRNPWYTLPTARTPKTKLIKKIQRDRKIHQYLAPGFDTAHPMDAEKPEECMYLFENAGVSTSAFFITEAKKIAWDLLKQDLAPAYAFYKQQLQLLQWQQPTSTWLLKWPYHLWHLDALLNTFPDALIIQIQRNPAEVIGSTCSLSALARSPFSKSVDANALGQFWLGYAKEGLQRAENATSHIPEQNLLTIGYQNLVKQPEQIVQEVLKKLSTEYSKTAEDNIVTFLNNKKNSSQKHHYALDQFGLSDSIIHKEYAGLF